VVGLAATIPKLHTPLNLRLAEFEISIPTSIIRSNVADNFNYTPSNSAYLKFYLIVPPGNFAILAMMAGRSHRIPQTPHTDNKAP